ncbi:Phosphatidylserine decarboxylase [hydrothermal vent metagenome]|uniref:phosphatidylserine decarboxylase n=1 Tax=hydrothermal vent metagenome TaxID=652676 RepID=A0A3B1B6F0_9ZZZZ
MSAPISEHLFALLQRLLPHHFLSRIMLKLTRSRGLFRRLFTPWFIQHFNIDMSQARESDWHQYDNFNHFFTRELKAGVRPIKGGENDLICPVDGCVSQAGPIQSNRIFQAKGHDYSLSTLLGGESSHAEVFTDGEFATLYLSPRDYHRIHMPIASKLLEVIHVPGRLFSVNPATARTIPGLFARNERVVCLFETAIGPMAMVLVGAIFVSSIETVWQGVVTPPAGKRIRRWDYRDKNIILKKAEEMGRFNMGSTVILLFAKNSMKWDQRIKAEHPLQMGQRLGEPAKRS